MEKDSNPSPFAFGAVMAGLLLASLLANFIPWERIGETLSIMWR